MALPLGLAIIAVAVVGSARTSLDTHRCAEAKRKDPSLLTVVAIVQSLATEFDRRSQLRQTDFQHAISLDARSVFRPPSTPMGTLSTNIKHIQEDKRGVCVQPLFVLAPWVEIKGKDDQEKNLRQDEWRRVAAESMFNRDVLIAPTIVDMHINAQVLMHVLEWSRQRVPWADYVVSMDTSVTINWASMIELFPPPSSRTGHANHELWRLASISDPGIDTLFYRDRRAGTWRQCADVGVTAFSRDLVHQLATMPFATQILHALHHPFKMYRSRCTAGALL